MDNLCEIDYIGGYIAFPQFQHHHCTDDAQKVETVLSAVIHIHTYVFAFSGNIKSVVGSYKHSH